MGRIIGIDLGTTNSLAAVWQEGRSRLIPNSLGEYLTPSVVSFDDKGMVYVGKIAKERLISHPEQTASVFKRFMGTEKTYFLGVEVLGDVEPLVSWREVLPAGRTLRFGASEIKRGRGALSGR